ncbi:uroporphyrinogen-III C-methyltransferase [Shimwellia pseudoproteus]|uniref:uroporphyrinogen-III C-methyltransferase n=1 Tax=Shimwellia pseudoproteus TaxID=570012 RepID=UPI0018EB3358|nr:uroporphyrinogen-III C-methyltransferase [Shimwellia pseudoproteus]MBJ3815942.1 uroporphyrinogen-III C-methyltransferase [Shimwellia pseudoproteus]
MTEQQKEPSAGVEETTTAVGSSAAKTKKNAAPTTPAAKSSRNGMAGIALGAIAIAIALAAGVSLYTWGKHQASSQLATNDTLSSQLAALQQQQKQQQETFNTLLSQQATQLAAANTARDQLAKALNDVQQKVAMISGSDAKTWLLAQSDFLVKLAGRKLWSDQDVTTAAALLKSADASLADMNDPSLIGARRAITEDIATLSTLTQVDYDGIILKLNQLTNQVDNLHLADNNTDDSPMDSDGTELSSSLTEWRQNLMKSWDSFMDSFITIRRRDETAVPLLAPNQDIYLRENIRSRLLIAVQAVPRHQNDVYKQSLENVATWVRAYYDTDDASTRAFLEELDTLSQQNITMDVPDALKSQPILEKLVQTRVRNLMAQPSSASAAPAQAHSAPAPESTPAGKPDAAAPAPAPAATPAAPAAAQGE